MSKPGIVLIGSGGHALSCFDVVKLENKYSISGIITINKINNTILSALPILGSDNDIPFIVSKYTNFLICVGQIKTPDIRMKLYDQVITAGGKLPTIISPLAYVSPYATIGSGTIIMHGAIINAGVVIGENCIVNTGAIIDHEAVVNNHTHISTGVILNGNVKVGERSFIGSGTVVKQGINIEKNSKVPMKLTINNDFIKSG